MKARIVLAGLLVSMMVVEVSAQRAEYDDMYFRGKDREKNKAIAAEDSYPAKIKKQKQDNSKQEDSECQEDDNSNPTDSYSARNVNPEYVSRVNSEKASEDESNYYLEGYTPPSSMSDFNNSYYNNTNWARNSYYANTGWNNPYYSCAYCGMSPYYGGGFYDPWMSPGFGYNPYYGSLAGLSISLMYGNYWNPYGNFGYGGYGNSYYGGYGYSGYYNDYYGSSRLVNYGKRPSRHSAIVTPSTRPSRSNISTNSTPNNQATVSNGGTTRARQTQDEYYVRPSRRTSSSGFDNSNFGNSTQRNSRDGDSFGIPSQGTRTRESYNPPSRTPSYTPSSSPSRGSNGSGSGGGSSSPRPRGRN